MGITGLLPLLRPIAKERHVEYYAGQTVAIDAYSWIHKGIYGSALEIVTKKPTRKFIDYCLIRARFLISFKVTPLFVFDGGHLPMKAAEEEERKLRREENKKLVEKALKAGDKSSAWHYANKCVDVTTDLAHQLVQALRLENISFIVAPYEADAQMAYLCKIGVVQAILTEDSDLLLFGCPRVLYKFNMGDGYVEEICIQENLTKLKKEYNFSAFTMDNLRHMCILSGCDYLPSIPKMGLKTAYRYISSFQGGSVDTVLKAIRGSGQFDVPKDYEANFAQADSTFLYQRVYCPILKCLVHLNPMNAEGITRHTSLDFVGPELCPNVAQRVALGELCPNSYKPFSDTVYVIPLPKQLEDASFSQSINSSSKKGKIAKSPSVLKPTQKQISNLLTAAPELKDGVNMKKNVEFWERITLKRSSPNNPKTSAIPLIKEGKENNISLNNKSASQPLPQNVGTVSPYFFKDVSNVAVSLYPETKEEVPLAFSSKNHSEAASEFYAKEQKIAELASLYSINGSSKKRAKSTGSFSSLVNSESLQSTADFRAYVQSFASPSPTLGMKRTSGRVRSPNPPSPLP